MGRSDHGLCRVFGSAGVGMSYGWWAGRRNRHRVNPDLEGAEPDIDITALAFTARPGRAKRGFLRWMAKYQAFRFFPLLSEGLDLRWSGIKAVWRGGLKARWVEAALLTTHIVCSLTAVSWSSRPVRRSCPLAPNHKGMLTLTAGHHLDFLRKQVRTSHKVTGGRWVDFAFGGLNFQIEHHPFPSMPPRAAPGPAARAGVLRHQGVSYSEGGLLVSYGQILRYLHEIGAPCARKRGRAASH
ncbi:fatty acid desaturase [Amycolatopsis sp. NPDC049159]|uniref:fatty acid desaturase n=1 Tax=Amycolatopsis sp. NPDC049159 TaxID=3157210 RepID=UPI0033DE52AB